MTKHTENLVTTQTALAAGASFTFTIQADVADRIALFVDDNAGNAPASYDLDIEVSYNENDDTTFMPRSSISSSTSTQHVYTDVAPFNWRFTVTNSSGASADFRTRVVAMNED